MPTNGEHLPQAHYCTDLVLAVTIASRWTTSHLDELYGGNALLANGVCCTKEESVGSSAVASHCSLRLI